MCFRNDCKLCQDFVEHTDHNFQKVTKASPNFQQCHIQNFHHHQPFHESALCLFMFIQPSNWSPDCLKYLQSVFVNANIRVLNSPETIKYATMSGSGGSAYLMRQWVLSTNHELKNVILSIEGANDLEPKCEVSDEEQHMLETLIR